MNQVNDALSGFSADELRAAVREVLREVLPHGIAAAAGGVPGGAGEDVSLSTDAELTAFVRRLAALCEDPVQRAAFQEGRHGFRLAEATRGFETVAERPPQPPTVTRIDRGAVTERAVLQAGAEGARLLLGRGAVLTPLARDKARSLGVEIEKEH